MKKIALITLILTAFTVGLFAQTGTEADPTKTGIVTAENAFQEISVSKMEDAGFWYGIFPADNGIIQVRDFPGGPKAFDEVENPLGKKAVPEEEANGILESDERVVGAKVSFYRRGVIDFTIKPIRPLPVEGITKMVSVWVAGRNTEHRLELLVSDHFGNDAVIPMGKLNFSGWKKLTVTIPPQIKQRDYHYNDRMGLSIDGFNVKCNIDETYGRYYLYLDDLRATTDLYSEESRDADDMSDAW